MTTQLLSDLREPPIAGRFYMVPAVQFMWCGVEALWPVIGPLHTDREFFKFDQAHYHIDARFIGKRLARQLFGWDASVSALAQTYPLAKRRGNERVIPKGRPDLHRMKCQTTDFPYHFHHQDSVSNMRAAYGDVSASARAKPIRLADGRALCPHRKVDLTTFVPDEDGVVTCPLHGLQVCIRADAGIAA